MYLGNGIANEEISGANSMGVELNHKAMNRAGDSEKRVGVLFMRNKHMVLLEF
jgi:hypothetical protein